MKDLVKVFEDTLLQSRNIGISDTNKFTFDDFKGLFELMLKYTNTCIEDTSKIEVINTDTVSAAVDLSKNGKVAILNMASAKRPGGGVINGARAQEECLFRCSNLIVSISSDFYPLKENEALYTKDAIFFKDRNYENMDPITVDVITIPAINLNPTARYDHLQNVNNYDELTKDKIRLMLSIPIIYGVKNIILGAWGCGVFKNDPNKISQYFYDILIGEGYIKQLDRVQFAIINDHNSVANNFDIFNSIFSK